MRSIETCFANFGQRLTPVFRQEAAGNFPIFGREPQHPSGSGKLRGKEVVPFAARSHAEGDPSRIPQDVRSILMKPAAAVAAVAQSRQVKAQTLSGGREPDNESNLSPPAGQQAR